MTLPENRKPLMWKDMPFAERPKAHPSTERLEIEKLKEQVAELEARIAKADALAEAVSFWETAEEPDVSEAIYRLKNTLTDYREGSDK